MYRVLKYACVSLYAWGDPDFLQHCFLQQSRVSLYHLPHRSDKSQSLVFDTHLRMQVAIFMQVLSLTWRVILKSQRKRQRLLFVTAYHLITLFGNSSDKYKEVLPILIGRSQSQNTYSIIWRRCASVVQLHLHATSDHPNSQLHPPFTSITRFSLNIKHTTEEHATPTTTANITTHFPTHYGPPILVHPDNV